MCLGLFHLGPQWVQKRRMSRNDPQGESLVSAVLINQTTGGNPHKADTDGQEMVVVQARNYIWDVNSTSWIREQQASVTGGGGSGNLAAGTIGSAPIA